MTKKFKKSEILTSEQRDANLKYVNAIKRMRNVESDEAEKEVIEAFKKFSPIIIYRVIDGKRIPLTQKIAEDAAENRPEFLISFSFPEYINLAHMPELVDDGVDPDDEEAVKNHVPGVAPRYLGPDSDLEFVGLDHAEYQELVKNLPELIPDKQIIGMTIDPHYLDINLTF